MSETRKHVERNNNENIPHQTYRIIKILSPMDQMVKNQPSMQETQETQVSSLSQEDLLEKEMATYSNVLGNPMNSGVWQATVHGVTKSRA